MRRFFDKYRIAACCAIAVVLLTASSGADGQYTEKILYAFTGGSDGSEPFDDLIADGQGNLYGTTRFGGRGGYGTVFKVTPQGKETVLYSFSGGSDGSEPFSGLVADAQGNSMARPFLAAAAAIATAVGQSSN